jgi:hypothetical protein
MTLTRISAVSLILGASGVAQADLVSNGDFSTYTIGGPNQYLGTAPGFATLSSWTSPGPYTVVYAPGTADSIGALYPPGDPIDRVYLWGPNNPAPGGNSLNGLTATSPSGGNFLASDSDPPFSGPISQTITGLTNGQTYTLSFDYGAAQFRDYNGMNYNGPTFSSWQVTLGSQTLVTSAATTLNIDSHGFSGWHHWSSVFTYTGSSDSQLLSFLAVGAPSGLPPVALLDSVSLQAVPEPSTFLLVGVGVGMLGLRAVILRTRAKPAGVGSTMAAQACQSRAAAKESPRP